MAGLGGLNGTTLLPADVYAHALSGYLVQPLPEWHYEQRRRDNWQASAWEPAPARLDDF